MVDRETQEARETVLDRAKELSRQAHDHAGGRYGPAPTLGDFDAVIRFADVLAVRLAEAEEALREMTDAAEPFVHEALACACIGPSGDSLPGECHCVTYWRKARERLAAVLAASRKEQSE